MAQALRNENADLAKQNSKYVVQMTSGSKGVVELENLIAPDESYEFFQVSKEAMGYRLEELKVIK